MNPEQLRRALARPNEATHPVELPDPADEEAFFLGQRDREELIAWVQLPWEEHIATPPPAVVQRERERREREEHGTCDLCGEPGTALEAIGHFRHPERFGDYVMAHGECGLDAGLELA